MCAIIQIFLLAPHRYFDTLFGSIYDQNFFNPLGNKLLLEVVIIVPIAVPQHKLRNIRIGWFGTLGVLWDKACSIFEIQEYSLEIIQNEG